VLSMTPTAAEAVRQLVAASPVSEDGGVRISAGETSASGTALQLSLVDGPEAADESLDENGAHVFLEPGVAQFLDDKVLDAQVDEGRVSFAVRETPDAGSGADG
jgi:iron-sulfur cluster assembly protein